MDTSFTNHPQTPQRDPLTAHFSLSEDEKNYVLTQVYLTDLLLFIKQEKVLAEKDTAGFTHYLQALHEELTRQQPTLFSITEKGTMVLKEQEITPTAFREVIAAHTHHQEITAPVALARLLISSCTHHQKTAITAMLANTANDYLASFDEQSKVFMAHAILACGTDAQKTLITQTLQSIAQKWQKETSSQQDEKTPKPPTEIRTSPREGENQGEETHTLTDTKRTFFTFNTGALLLTKHSSAYIQHNQGTIRVIDHATLHVAENTHPGQWLFLSMASSVFLEYHILLTNDIVMANTDTLLFTSHTITDQTTISSTHHATSQQVFQLPPLPVAHTLPAKDSFAGNYRTIPVKDRLFLFAIAENIGKHKAVAVFECVPHASQTGETQLVFIDGRKSDGSSFSELQQRLQKKLGFTLPL